MIHRGMTGVPAVRQMAVSKETYDDCIAFYISAFYISAF